MTTAESLQCPRRQRDEGPVRPERDPAASVAVAPPRAGMRHIAWEVAVEVIVAAALAFMPFAFGTVEAWSERIAFTLVAAAFTCVAARRVFRPDVPLVATWAYVPIALFLLVLAGQLLPLPEAVVRVLSPEAAKLRGELLADLPANVPAPAATLSLYPPATLQKIRLVVAASMLFFVVVNVYRRPEQVKRLLGVIAAVGLAVALLALAQDVSGAGGIYWGHAGFARSGPYNNHNNFAQLMNLSIGSALALLLVHLRERQTSRHRSLRALLDALRRCNPRLASMLLAAIVLGAISIFLSGSRGGMLSLIAAFAVTTLALAASRDVPGRGWLAVGVGLPIFVALLYFGFDQAYERLATLHDLQRAAPERWQDNQDALKVFGRFWPLGIGLGAHEVVFPTYSRGVFRSLGVYIENEYMQLAEEAGVIGLAIVLLFVAILGIRFLRSLRRRKESPVQIAAIGLGFGFVAVAVQSSVDFGQRLASVGGLTAVICGLMIVVTRFPVVRPAAAPIGRVRRTLLPAAGLAISAILAGWLIIGANSAARAEAAWARAGEVSDELAEFAWEGDDAQYAALLRNAGAAARAEPADVHYRHWLNVYRWRDLVRATGPDTVEAVLSGEKLRAARQIRDDFQVTRSLCPTYGPTYCVLGQIEREVGDDAAGRRHIRLGYRLAPSDDTTSFVAGQLDAEEGRFDDATEKLRRSLFLGHDFDAVVNVFIRDASRPDLAVGLLADDAAGLLRLAKNLDAAEGPASKIAAADARRRALALFERDAEDPDAPPALLAQLGVLLARDGQHAKAAECLDRALKYDYGNVGWRFARAKALAEVGQVEQAMREVRICLRLQPDSAAAKTLLGDLSVRGTRGASAAQTGGAPARVELIK